MNFKQLLFFLTVGFGIVVLYSTYKVIGLELFPWLNVLTASTLSLFAMIFSFLIRGKSKKIQILIFVFFAVQLLLNYFLLQDAEVLKQNWRWLFYPITLLIFILSFSKIGRKQGKMKSILLTILVFSLCAFCLGIFQKDTIWFSIEISLFLLFSIGAFFSKDKTKLKTEIVESK